MTPVAALEAGPPASSGVGRLRELRSLLADGRSLRGRRFCEAYTSAIDEWLSELMTAALETGRVDPAGVALIAVGGYGRRELCPGSDLDLVLVHDGVRRIDAVAEALWYPLWDASVHVDHSVRTPRETADVARADLKSAMGLLAARVVAGDRELGERVIDTARRQWAARPNESLPRLRESVTERWSRHGELAFLLEPDVKQARGGLRDLEAVRAAGLAAPSVASLLEDPRLEGAEDVLLAVRVALHATTGRRGDLLLVEDQDAVARRLGYADGDELLPNVAAAARRVSWIAEQVWRRIDASIAGQRRASRPRPVDAGVALRGDELILDGSIDPGTDAAMALRIAAASARTGIPIAIPSLLALERDAAAPAEPWPRPTLDALLDLLGCGRAAVPQLETLDHLGVLGRYLREWPAVRSRPQRNAYHRFTVDRHLFETAAEAAELSRTIHRPDLLLVGALLHDIGKGFPGDHRETGERLAGVIAGRMGFDANDVSTIGRLVRNHLVLADAATRRDLSDPATAARVAGLVGSADELDLLAGLTRADSIATGPAAWGTWKATLLDELVVRTRAHLAGAPPERRLPEPSASQRRLMAERRVRLVAAGSSLTVVAPDRPGLLSLVAGALAVNRLPVRSATGLSEGGMAVEVFDLDLAGRDPPDWAGLEHEVAAALADPGRLAARLAERSRSVRPPRRPGAAHPAPPRVLVDQLATPRATVLEVRAPDGIGLLSRIAGAIAGCGCDIGFVRAQTLGHEVVDTFYVTDQPSGRKLGEADRLADLERSILDAIAEPS